MPTPEVSPTVLRPPSVPELKQRSRAQARARRDALTSEERAVAAQAISAHVRALLPLLPLRRDRLGHAARGIGLYSTLGSEVDTRPLQMALTRQCYPYALPTVHQDAQHPKGPGTLAFARVDARTPLTLSPLGIHEPPAQLEAEPDCHHRLAALFVPCLAFSADGVRLGYGRGYYDRLLAHFHGHIIALAYACQQQDDLVAGAHDVPLHAVVTEAGLYLPSGSPLQGRLGH